MWLAYLVLVIAVSLCTFVYLGEEDPEEDDTTVLFGRGMVALTVGLFWPISVLLAVIGVGVPLLYRRWAARRAAKKKQKPVNTENG